MFPASIVAKIKKLILKFPIKISLKIDLSNFRLIHIDARQNNSVKLGAVILNPNQISREEDLKELLTSALDTERIPVVKLSTQEVLKRIEHTPAHEKEILEKLKPVLDTVDYQALQASLVIRLLFKQKIPIENYKFSLIQRFGDRGRKICDIVSAGYLESEIVPLFDKLAAVENGLGIFKQQFNRIVLYEGFAVFVKSALSKEGLKRVITGKLVQHKKIGVSYVNLHAIGRRNVSIAQAAIGELVKSEDAAIIELVEDPPGNPFFIFAKIEGINEA